LSHVTLEGFANISGGVWKEHRRFLIKQLRDLGLGKSIMEGHLKDEMNNLMKEVDKHAGKPIDFRMIFGRSVQNNLFSLAFGRNLAYDDPLRETTDKLLEPNSVIGVAGFLAFFPQVSRFFFKYLSWTLFGQLQQVNDMFKSFYSWMKLVNEKTRNYFRKIPFFSK